MICESFEQRKEKSVLRARKTNGTCPFGDKGSEKVDKNFFESLGAMLIIAESLVFSYEELVPVT